MVAAIVLTDALMAVFYYKSKKIKLIKEDVNVTFDKILFISLIYKFINTIVLGPLWLAMLFGYSYRYYLLVRFVKFPIEVLLVSVAAYTLNNRLSKLVS